MTDQKTYREFVDAPDGGFPDGLSVVCEMNAHKEVFPNLGLNYSVLKLRAGEQITLGRGQVLSAPTLAQPDRLGVHTAALSFDTLTTMLYLTKGAITVTHKDTTRSLSRESVFDFVPPLTTYERTMNQSMTLALTQVLNAGPHPESPADMLARVQAEQERVIQAARQTYIDFLNHTPRVVAFSGDQTLSIQADKTTKLLLAQCAGTTAFGVRFITTGVTAQFGDRSTNDERFVSEIISATRYPEMNLTVGDIWPSLEGVFTSYVPHRHPQPEIYYHESSDALAPGLAQLQNPDFWQRTKHEQTQVVHDFSGHSQAHFPYHMVGGKKVRVHDWYLWVMPHMDRTRDVSLDRFRD